jgi:hypothetical protein
LYVGMQIDSFGVFIDAVDCNQTPGMRRSLNG